MNKDELIKLALSDKEARIKLAQEMYKPIRDNLDKARLQYEIDRLYPLCHKIYHPFLGNGVFKDTCPECGWKKEQDKKEE